MSIKIESGIPVPEKRGRYPLALMKVGQSFVYSDNVDYKKTNAANALVNAANKKNGSQFVSGEHGGKIRVWRIK